MEIFNLKLYNPKNKNYDFNNPNTINGIDAEKDISASIDNFDNKKARNIDGGTIDTEIISPQELKVEIGFGNNIEKDGLSCTRENISKHLYHKRGWEKIVNTDGRLFERV